MRLSLVTTALLIATFAMGACKPEYLPGTRVEATDFNREVVKFLADYENAIESRSADKVLNLVSEDYWEDNGTVEQSDDYGIEGLRENLSKQLGFTKTIMLEMHVQHIEEENDLIRVDYRFRQRALLSMESGDKWVSHTDVNRLILKKSDKDNDESLFIVAGL